MQQQQHQQFTDYWRSTATRLDHTTSGYNDCNIDAVSKYVRESRAGRFDKVMKWLFSHHDHLQFRVCQFFEARSEEELRRFVRECAQVDGKCDCCGRTMLHMAVEMGSGSIVCYLLARNANVNARNSLFETPLHQCCSAGNLDLAELLLRYSADPNVTDELECTPLHLSTRRQNLDMVRLLLQHGATPKLLFSSFFQLSPLHVAVRLSSLAMVQVLLEHGAEVDVVDATGSTPIYVAVEMLNYEIAEMLLKSGASVRTLYRRNSSLLHLASGLGLEFMVTLLLESGSDVNLADDNGTTSLHQAAECGYSSIVKKLVRAGANVNAVDKWSRTPLLMAIVYNRPEVVDCLAEFRADTSDLQVPIQRAVQAGYLEVLKSLMFRVNVRENHTMEERVLRIAVNLGELEVVKYLIGLGANVNARGRRNVPLINDAVCLGDTEMVKLLMDAGADLMARDDLGRTAMFHAVRGERLDLVRLLIDTDVEGVIEEAYRFTHLLAERAKSSVNSFKGVSEFDDVWCC